MKDCQSMNMKQKDLLNKDLISRELVEDNNYSSLATYEIAGYGQTTFAEKKEANGAFRKAYVMMPFEYMEKKSNDFDWSYYHGHSIEKIKDTVNKFIIHFSEFRKAGKGLYIYSKTKGSGKTLLSCILANELLDRVSVNIKFVTVLDFIEMTKKGFKSDKAAEDMENMRNATVLILDDIGVQMSKEWVDTVLYRLINHRASNKLVTIFTSNITTEDLKIDERIVQRIEKMTIPLPLPEVSVRKKLVEQENNEFLNGFQAADQKRKEQPNDRRFKTINHG